MKRIIPLFLLVATLFSSSVIGQENCDCAAFTKEAKAKFGKANLGGKFDEARTVIAEVLKNTDPCCQAVGYAMQAILFNTEGKTDESYASAQKALALLKNRYNTFASIEGNRMVGMYYNRKGNADSCIIFYYKSLEMAEKENDQYTLAKLYANISLVYINQKQIDKGLELTKKSLGAAMLPKDTNAIAQAYANMVTIYGHLYEATDKIAYLDTSQQFAVTALVYAKASKHPITIIRNYLSMTKFSLAKENFNSADLFRYSLAYVNEKTNPAILNSMYIDRGAAYLGLKKYTDAIESLLKHSVMPNRLKTCLWKKIFTENYTKPIKQMAKQTCIGKPGEKQGYE